MTFETMDKQTHSPSASNNIKKEFTDLLREESQKKFEQPKPNKLFFYFFGTIKQLKKYLWKNL